MSRDPESVYRSKPDTAMPLFEQPVSREAEKVLKESQGEPMRLHPQVALNPCDEMRSRHIAAQSHGKQAHARRTDPETSFAAAKSVCNLGRTRDAILKILREHGPCTDEQIAEIQRKQAGITFSYCSPSGLRSRRAELVRMKLVVDSGQVGKTASGRPTIIWKVAK